MFIVVRKRLRQLVNECRMRYDGFVIRLKNKEQIDGIRVSCKMLAAMFREIESHVKAGVTGRELDEWARNWIKKAGGKPAFYGFGSKKNPFPGALCISVNDEVIHGIPSERELKNGDLVGIDCGIDLGGYISDQAVSFEIGRVAPEIHRLSEDTRAALYRGIEAARTGDRLLQIGRAVESFIKPKGYGIVYQWCGHGVGLEVHEDPSVPNVPHGANPKMREGMVLAIEPMICMGGGEVNVLDDGWTVVTADGGISAHWEHTIALFHDHTEILTE
jgi:methionyl aminopeptidase